MILPAGTSGSHASIKTTSPSERTVTINRAQFSRGSTLARDKQVAIIRSIRSADLGVWADEVSIMGPSTSPARYAGAPSPRPARWIGYDVLDWGDVETAVQEATEESDASARYLPEIKAPVAGSPGLSASRSSRGSLPLVLGGDHSVALGTLGGLARARGIGGVLWIDAHGDLNTPETSPIGNVHGMPLAAALGSPTAYRERCVDPAGGRAEPRRTRRPAVARRERERIRELGIRAYTMSDIDRIGIERAIRESLTQIAGPGFVHVSLDMDALDPSCRRVGTPVRGGLSYREAHLALELVAESGLAGSSRWSR